MKVPILIAFLLSIVAANAASLLGLGHAPVIQEFFHGDSITFGFSASSTALAFPSLTDRNLSTSNYVSPACSTATIRGISGQSWNYAWPSATTTNTLIQDFPISIVPYIVSRRNNFLVAFAGTNGMLVAGHSAATEYADWQTYLTNALVYFPADHIITITCLPRNDAVYGLLNETTRSNYNALLVSGAATYGYKVARIDQNALMGCANCWSNTLYFADGTHPTDLGHSTIANLVYTAITQ